MQTKTVVKAVLLIFVALSVGWLFIMPGQEKTSGTEANPLPAEGASAPAPNPGQPSEAKPNPPVLPNRVIVYYFHTTYRCPTCHKIENYTKEAVEAGFAQALKEGRLVFQALNVEEDPNAHFIQDYQLHAKSVVVVEIKDNKQARWKNLAQVWELVGNKEDFFRYIQSEVNLYLQGK
jgi:hypothetical protein